MKKNSVILFFGAFLLFGLISFGGAFSGEGTGTEGDPYQITTCDELNETRDNLTAHYVLMNDINFSECDLGYTTGEGWLPIGNDTNSFEGYFNGSGHSIYDLFIDRSDTNYIGLFGKAVAAIIEDVHLENVNVIGGNKTGGLAGEFSNSQGQISYSIVTGNVTGENRVGGLVGHNSYSEITQSSFEGNVIGTGEDYTGGLVGFNEEGGISASSSTGNVTGENRVGGLVGFHQGTQILLSSYSDVFVEGNDFVGGLIGANHQGTIFHSHSLGEVKGNDYVGGLV